MGLVSENLIMVALGGSMGSGFGFRFGMLDQEEPILSRVGVYV